MNNLNKLNCNNNIIKENDFRIIVFLLCRDRLYATYYSIKHWLKMKNEIKLYIVIVDHYSTYAPLLDYYHQLLKNSVDDIYFLKERKWRDAVGKELPIVIADYLKKNKKIDYYIVSDIDIILINLPSNMFDLYRLVLSNCDVKVVGPSLMVNDISSKFPHYKKVYAWETHYISRNHYDVLYQNNYYSFVEADIDTIFGMRKRKTKFKRHSNKSYRSLSPYVAHHIDWYLSSNNLPDSFLYYINHTKRINHSGSAFNNTNSLKQP